MKILVSVVFLLACHLSVASTLSPVFESVSKNQLLLSGFDTSQVVFETENEFIMKSPLTNFTSYDYYFIQLGPQRSMQNWYQDNLNVVYQKAGEFLIVEIANPSQLQAAALNAHEDGGFCGMIQKLSGAPIELAKIDPPLLVRAKKQEVAQATSEVKIDNILQTMKTMVSWGTRYESDNDGVKTGEKLKALYETLIPDDRTDVEIELVNHQGSEQQSIIVRIKGNQNPEKIVILGSHIDSINRSDLKNAPGADDNASGTATNMEAFRVLMDTGYRSKNTIEIHGYGAEEIGLVGSKEMAVAYKNANKQVASMVQFDMNGFAGNGEKITFVSNKTNRPLTNQLRDLVSMYNGIPSASGFMIFGSSDHASWNEQGFPVAFPTEDPFAFNRQIHTENDTMDTLNSPKQIEEFAKLGVAYLMHFGN